MWGAHLSQACSPGKNKQGKYLGCFCCSIFYTFFINGSVLRDFLPLFFMIRTNQGHWLFDSTVYCTVHRPRTIRRSAAHLRCRLCRRVEQKCSGKQPVKQSIARLQFGIACCCFQRGQSCKRVRSRHWRREGRNAGGSTLPLRMALMFYHIWKVTVDSRSDKPLAAPSAAH